MAKKNQAKKAAEMNEKRSELRDRVMLVLAHSGLHKAVALMLLVAVIVVGGIQLSNIDMLPIETVKIEGEFNYLSKSKLKKHAMPYVRGGFLSVDLKEIRHAVVNLPWVEDVSIRRQWPNALSIRVIEKQPVAYWGDDGLLSSRFDLFKPERIDLNLNLPHMIGPNGQHGFMLQELGRMQAWLAGTKLVINKVMQDARRSWTLYMASGLELRLGRNNQHERMHRFVDIYKKRLLKNKQKIRHVDMRYTNGFAVAWQDQEA